MDLNFRNNLHDNFGIIPESGGAEMVTASQQEAVYIVGPAVQRDNGVVEAIYSLYYLPMNFKLLLPAAMPADSDFHHELTTLVKENALESRVHFLHGAASSTGPEAFASGVLTMTRQSR